VPVVREVADHAFVLENGCTVYSGAGADEGHVQALASASAEEWHLDEVRRT
jgi:hypothetical protein